jgi:hypothetical protein
MKLFTRFVAALACVGMIGCGGVKIKQNAVLSAQGIESTLRTARETELTLYQSGTVKELTPALHKQINSSLVKAFDDNILLAQALKAYRSGDPVPASLNALMIDVNDTMNVALKLLPSTATSDLVEKISAVISATQQVAISLGGK